MQASTLRRTTAICTAAVEKQLDMPDPTRPRASSILSFDEDFDESYFEKTYVPLSNLPTPPLSAHSQDPISPSSVFSAWDNEFLDPKLLGPAIHLTNLIPTSSSLETPAVYHVQAILTRASVSKEVIAFAVCILDALNSRFARAWRQELPLSPDEHIDSVPPELIALCALVLAVKFTDDRGRRSRFYARDWGNGLWSLEQINETERIILENLGYRLLPLWDEKIIGGALRDMDRAAKYFGREEDLNIFESMQDLDTGSALEGIDAVQLTPADTPLPENTTDIKTFDNSTQRAFSDSDLATIVNQQLRLSYEESQQEYAESDFDGVKEPFPAFDLMVTTDMLES